MPLPPPIEVGRGKWEGFTKHETPSPKPTKSSGKTQKKAHSRTHQKGSTSTTLQASQAHEMRKGRMA